MPAIEDILKERPAPTTLPPKIAEARKIAHWGKLAFLLMALLFILAAGWNLLWWFTWMPYGFYFPFQVIYYGVGTAIAFLGALMVDSQIIAVIDQGRFSDARNNTVLWMILGFIAGVLPGLLLLIAYMNMSETAAPTSAPAQNLQTQQPAAQQPPPQTQQPYTPPPPPTVQTQQPAPQQPAAQQPAPQQPAAQQPAPQQPPPQRPPPQTQQPYTPPPPPTVQTQQPSPQQPAAQQPPPQQPPPQQPPPQQPPPQQPPPQQPPPQQPPPQQPPPQQPAEK